MKIQKAYKFRIYPTAQQEQQLSVEFGNARFVWNHALNLRTTVYSVLNETMNYVAMSKHITQLKKTENYEWLANSSADVITQKLVDLDTAYNNFFKGRAVVSPLINRTTTIPRLQFVRHAYGLDRVGVFGASWRFNQIIYRVTYGLGVINSC